MKPKRMHLFTFIQLLFFVALYTVKSIKTIAIAFPILIAACIPFRLYVLPRIFTRDELILIDSDPRTVKLWIAHHEHEEEEGEPLLEGGETKKDEGSEAATAEEGDIESGHVQPTIEVPAKPRVRRKKALSCPTGALMFSEEPSVLGPQLKPQMRVGGSSGFMLVDASPKPSTAHPNIPAYTPDMLEGIDLEMPSARPRRRPRPSREERRATSCPASNELFGKAKVYDIQLPTVNESSH